ncbi:hypothetical protein MPTK1_7g10430 [Marchantia polymorpha subsp. ruderalis]|uniref:CRC domain-containing protein n=2 Tax=Marchantia polymorpha TaxID=3197 RepID=A0AAF6BY35_MARPO|nr:hypothetical protein MARPO_0003s0062 [Marchantia polymorpha]BBN16919.1 hypothetical protein Mp_7g10430 [Marchantia polymorpha subsp. ruderalis]|eukprot:PTQ49160.1 hypothetical protein MARPO_0003s0062 [Marchantia polymorpha]
MLHSMISTRTLCLVVALMLVIIHYQVAIEALPGREMIENFTGKAFSLVECACKGTFCAGRGCVCNNQCFCKCS